MPVEYKRQVKWDEVRNVSSELDGLHLDDAVKFMTDLLKIYGPTAKLELSVERYSHTDQRNLYLYMSREEDDKEYKTRISQEEKWAKSAEIAERAKYEELKKKFGGQK